MIFKAKNNLRIYTATIYHNGKQAVSPVLVCSYNGNSLSCLYTVARLNQILCIIAINGLQSIIVTNHYHIAK